MLTNSNFVVEKFRIIVGADVLPDLNSGAAGTVIETNKALLAEGHDVQAFWADSLERRIRHGNLHYLLELPRAYRREVRKRLDIQAANVVQLSQPYAYLAGRYVQRHHPETVMVWRSHGLEAKVEKALRDYGPTFGKKWMAPLQWLSEQQRWRVQRNAVRWSDGIIVPCADDKAFLVDHFGAVPERVRVIWHGVPDEYIDTPVLEPPARWGRLLHVSQMSANKGAEILYRVIAEVLEREQHATMTWVCPKPTHRAILDAIPPELALRIRLIDWVTREELRDLYDSHGIFVFPCLAEGAAKVVMEAMSRGMCVVASDTSGPRDYITHGKNGFLTPVADASGMIRYVVEASQNCDRASEMGREARCTAHAFRWSRCAAEAVSFYRDLQVIKQQT